MSAEEGFNPYRAPAAELTAAPTGQDITRLGDLSAQQWKSGIAAWLGWLFDGLDMHLYVLVATPFVAELLGGISEKDPRVGYYSSWIQAAFLIGWALGGGFFGRIGDRLGRSRALMLTILTYAAFTGLSFFAQTWWQLLIFRFLAALGIGGEWAVGASLLSETWPSRWRPWLAAVLQTGVNIGVLLATISLYVLAKQPPRYVFLVGILPALLVLWIRRAVPEPEIWEGAHERAGHVEPRFVDLFRGPIRRVSILTLLVCALSLTAHWAFLYWYLQHLRSILPDYLGPLLPTGATAAEKTQLLSQQINEWVSRTMSWLMVASITGNFLAAAIARTMGYRRAIGLMCLVYFVAMVITYSGPRDPNELWYGYMVMGLCQGLFGLFTMYMPPLFPVLLRTTGAGFCYNIGRIAAGLGTVFFMVVAPVGNYRVALVYAAFLFLPAAAIAWMLPEPPDEASPPEIAPE